MIRLQKYLAQCGVASRRQSERFIVAGRVCVNGTVAQLGDSIDPRVDLVTIDGEPLQQDRKVYLLLNKPRGVITTLKDTHRRRTVVDCLTGMTERVFPVGRLDYDVEGALILTNDGELAYRLTHPSYQIDKVYLTRVEGHMEPDTARMLSNGVMLEDGRTAPAEVVILQHNSNSSLIRLTIHEGRKREVKRMCAKVGHPVRELKRLSIGGITINGLEPGAWRHLQPDELQTLRRQTGL